ncbi:hypothetical protein CPB86DRAFT_632891 [Serendipita vermifera]|nr:hypothetical protein CPB86DRAFT_632891 [Serendipita vermifera]
MCSSSLKILVWAVEQLDPPPGILGNLRAFSLSTDNISSTFSLRQLLSSAPYLSHLHLQITLSNAVILSEEVQATSLLWLSLEVGVSVVNSPHPKFMPWTLPRLQVLQIAGCMKSQKKPELDRFLSQHSKTLIGLDIDALRYYNEAIGFVPAMSLSLWTTCPHVRTLRVGGGLIARLISNNTYNGQERPNASIPPLTLIMDQHSGLSEHFLGHMALLKRFFKVKKVINSKTWPEVKSRDNSVESKSREDLKQRAEELLKKIEPLDILIVDIFEEPLPKFFRRLIDGVEQSSS